MTTNDTIRKSLGDFYGAMSSTARTAADVVRHPTTSNVVTARESAVQTLLALYSLESALTPSKPAH